MKEMPISRVLVDLDCEALNLQRTGQMCDFLYVDEDNGSSRVAPIEIKSGSFKGSKVADQLQGGADLVDKWLPSETGFRLIPILVHGKGVRKQELKRLRQARIRVREHTAQVVLVRCNSPLENALNQS